MSMSHPGEKRPGPVSDSSPSMGRGASQVSSMAAQAWRSSVVRTFKFWRRSTHSWSCSWAISASIRVRSLRAEPCGSDGPDPARSPPSGLLRHHCATTRASSGGRTHRPTEAEWQLRIGGRQAGLRIQRAKPMVVLMRGAWAPSSRVRVLSSRMRRRWATGLGPTGEAMAGVPRCCSSACTTSGSASGSSSLRKGKGELGNIGPVALERVDVRVHRLSGAPISEAPHRAYPLVSVPDRHHDRIAPGQRLDVLGCLHPVGAVRIVGLDDETPQVGNLGGLEIGEAIPLEVEIERIFPIDGEVVQDQIDQQMRAASHLRCNDDVGSPVGRARVSGRARDTRAVRSQHHVGTPAAFRLEDRSSTRAPP